PDNGEIRVCGHPVGMESKKITSFLPDRNYLPKWMKVRDCLALFQDFYQDFDMHKAENILNLLGLEKYQTFNALSKGNAEKLHLALVLSRKAQLYLLDEPIGGVDPAARDYILKMIVQHYVEDSTMIVATHLVADIEKIFDEVIFLDRGEIKLSGSVDEIREKQGKSLDQIFREVYYVG
ncbi:MAG: ABC transporter ATP-binding protein, partial [Bacillota bacterium]|nr:ABC transporter ATP-binding protein [Bacillota bacterium]